MRDILLEFFQKHFNVFTRLYDEYGLITMLTSYRDLNLKKNFLPTINEKWNVINYLFGGTDFEKYRVEFEIYDIILFWGILGGVCYLYFYNRFILKVKKLSPFGKKQILFLLVIALLSGTFFNNGPLVIYLLVVLNFLHFKTTL